MGTRGAFGFHIDGETKVSYNHYDSYPEGLGDSIVKWVESAVRGQSLNPVELLTKVRALEPVPENRPPTDDEIARLEPWTDLSVSKKSTEDWYCLLRKAQGDLSAMLEAGFYSDYKSFLADSLFCEWAYVTNFDDELFEVYRGFQESDHDFGRYAKMKRGDPKYAPVALVTAFPLANIPENWVKMVQVSDEE